MRTLKWISAILLGLCGLAAFGLAAANPSQAGGRGGLIVTGLLFIIIALTLLRRKRP